MMGTDLIITPEIKLKHPTVKHVFEVGEMQYLPAIASFVATPFDYKVELDDAGINFEDMSEFDFFCYRATGFSNSVVNQIIDGFDFANVELLAQGENIYLCDMKTMALLDEIHYKILCDYLRAIHGLKKNYEEYGNELTRKMVIESERQERNHKAYKAQQEPFLLNCVSGLINCSESKYDYHNVWDLPYYVFIDAIRRTQKVMEFKGLMSGMYSGMVDLKKIDMEKMSWIGKLE